MLVKNTVTPPIRPKMQGKNITPDETWLNDVGPLSLSKTPVQSKQKTAVGYHGYGPLETLLKDDSITEVACIGPHRTYVERNGLLEEVPCHFENEGQMLRVIESMLLQTGQQLQSGWPIIDVRLPNGVQLHTVLPPNAVNGPVLTLRKEMVQEPLTLAQLVRSNTLSQPMAEVLQACVEGRLNILISGTQNSGRTTLLNALCAAIPDEERIITIEESAELRLHQRQVIGLQVARNVTLRDLLMSALHMGPERLILDECRGEEVLELLHALYTGHNGSLMTVYARDAQDCISRFVAMCHSDDIAEHIIRHQIVDSVDVIVQMSRMPDGTRKVIDISEVLSGEEDELKVQSIFRYSVKGLDAETGKVTGDFATCGISPLFLTKLAVMDIHLPQEMFITGQ